MKREAVVIGASSGGMKALLKIFSGLPRDFKMPIVVVQHIKATSENYSVEVFGNHCRLPVKEAEEKEKIAGGAIYLAPPDYHLLIEPDKTFSLSVDEKVNFARPSIDVLFESAAFAYKSSLVGILLTGANHDGAAGMLKIKNAGGLTISQDPETAECAVMPEAAIKLGAADLVLSLQEIPDLLKQLNND